MKEFYRRKKEILLKKYEGERVELRVSDVDTREAESGRTRKAMAKELGWVRNWFLTLHKRVREHQEMKMGNCLTAWLKLRSFIVERL